MSVSVPALNLNTNTVTITAWIKINELESYPGIFAWTGSGENRAQFLLGDHNNQLSYFWNDDFEVSPLVVPSNQWTFVALVVSPTDTIVYMATNSTLASWTNANANASAGFTSASSLANSPFGRYSGGIDEVAIFNQTLTGLQIGNLVLASLATLPAVTLTAPADGGSVSASPNILLTASVATNGHAIGAVKFYDSAALLGQSATPPYQFTWTGATTGIHTLLAQVSYDGSSTISSSPANITVTNAAINLTPTNIVALLSGTNFTLSWPADHLGWRLQAQTNPPGVGISTNAANWFTVVGSTNAAATNLTIIRTNGSVFYRLIIHNICGANGAALVVPFIIHQSNQLAAQVARSSVFSSPSRKFSFDGVKRTEHLCTPETGLYAGHRGLAAKHILRRRRINLGLMTVLKSRSQGHSTGIREILLPRDDSFTTPAD